MKPTNATPMVQLADDDRNWFIVDATDQTVGRIASRIAPVLRGKHKPQFSPHWDLGDYVVVVNAEKVRFTGRKWQQKNYYRHSRYPGGLKITGAEEMLQKHPERILEQAIKGMLPKNRLGRKMFKKLKVYAGSDHPHAAQQPEPLAWE